MKKLLIFTIILFFGQEGYAQLKTQNKMEEVKIESSIQCEMCSNRLDNMFADFWAVKNVDYNIEEQTITVKYNSKKTNEEEIREAIASTGYDADDLVAKEEAYQELPACCRKGAHIPE